MLMVNKDEYMKVIAGVFMLFFFNTIFKVSLKISLRQSNTLNVNLRLVRQLGHKIFPAAALLCSFHNQTCQLGRPSELDQH